MTEPELCALDGLALTTEGYRLGLAPPGVVCVGGWFAYEGTNVSWFPHVSLPQADSCFRKLRELGWSQQTSYNVFTRVGLVRAHNAGGVFTEETQDFQVHFGAGCPQNETRALLLVSVLAASAAEGA